MEANVYNQKGKSSGTVKVPESVFGASWNADLVHQVYTSMMSEKRVPVANAKMRGEVRGGGKKPWKQKGTGRARHGSIRSPLWPGGGVTHGPRAEKNYSKKINKTMKVRALATILSKKFKDGEILFVKNIAFTEPKTKEARETLVGLSSVEGFKSLTGKKKNAAYIAIPKLSPEFKRSFSNIGSVEVTEIRNLNVTDALTYKHIVIVDPEESFKILESRTGSAKSK